MIKQQYSMQGWVLLTLGLGILFLLIFRASERQSHVKEHVTTVKSAPKHPVEPIPSFLPVEQFSYPEGKARPSPFVTKKNILTQPKTRPNVNRPKYPLEAYPLDALKFSGVLEEGPKRWALILLPNGQLSRVTVGEYMGQNDGKVVDVTENSLIIEEEIPQQEEWVRRKVILRLQNIQNSKTGAVKK